MIAAVISVVSAARVLNPVPIAQIALIGEQALWADDTASYLLSLEVERVVCQYTMAANLSTCRDPYDQMPYYGHFAGHFLSATAQAGASSQLTPRGGRPDVAAHGERAIELLSRAQDAWGVAGFEGYLFVKGPALFDSLLAQELNNTRCLNYIANLTPSVPFYSLHKVLAGLRDHYTLLGSKLALKVFLGASRWAARFAAAAAAKYGEDAFELVLCEEFGGMAEVLYDAALAAGNDAELAAAAARFHKWQRFVRPLSQGKDVLTGIHANTHLPQVVSAARGFEATGLEVFRDAVSNFAAILDATRSFATKGSSDREYWGPPMQQGDQLDANTEESCTQYNMLKIYSYLLMWNGSASTADVLERLAINGLWGNRHVERGDFIYFLPLGGAGVQKGWGGATTSGTPCCWGTLSETFSKLAEFATFSDPTSGVPTVARYFSHSAFSPDGTLLVAVQTDYPSSPTVLLRTASGPLTLRVPSWADPATASISTPAGPVPVPGANTWVTVADASSGVNATFPMRLWIDWAKDTRQQFAHVGAIMYGPLVLAGLTATSFCPGVFNKPIDEWVKRVDGDELVWEATPDPTLGGQPFLLIPLFRVMDEVYTVYLHFDAPPHAGYDPAGTMVPLAKSADVVTGGTASMTTDPHGRATIRTGDPQTRGTAMAMTGLLAPGYSVVAVALNYSYNTGYYNPAQTNGPNFTVVFSPSVRDPFAAGGVVVYKSPHYTDYPYDKCEWCYSPPVPVNVTLAPPLSAASELFVWVVVDNNDHNLQIPLPLGVTVYWAASSPSDARPADLRDPAALAEEALGLRPHEAGIRYVPTAISAGARGRRRGRV